MITTINTIVANITISDCLTIVNIIAFIILTVKLVSIAKQQNNIQKANIKLQMFDKRYAVYDAILKSQEAVTKEDFSHDILSGNNDIHIADKLINDANKNLKLQTQLSRNLFDKDINEKIKNICYEFDNITKQYFNFQKDRLRFPGEFTSYDKLYFEVFMAETTEEKEQYENQIEKACPNIFKFINDLTLTVLSFDNFIKNSRIITDFDKYLIIDNLDK